MRHGFIRCAAATPSIRVADCSYNTEEILRLMNRAASESVRLLVLPELCITGYTCGDLFLQTKLLESALDGLRKVVLFSKGLNMITIVGLPLQNGHRLYNCAAVVSGGRILGVVPKQNIPNYKEFYEQRIFSSPKDENGVWKFEGEEVPFGTRLLFRAVEMPEFCLGIEICEDLWGPVPPSSHHALAGATLIANLSASNEIIGKADYRRMLVQSQAGRLLCGYIYASAGGGESTTDLVFSGHNLIAEGGSLLAESALFSGDLIFGEVDASKLMLERAKVNTFGACGAGYLTIDFSVHPEETPLTRRVERFPFVPAEDLERAQRCETIMTIQTLGLKQRLEHSGAKKALIGVSGGLDSCLALLVAARACDLLGRPRRDVIGVTMPCFGTTRRTRTNAERLSEELGITFRTIDIGDSVSAHFRDIGQDPNLYDAVFENAQARERTQILMDLANKENGLVVGTGDLSELALGWATYNGDHMSMYGVNASVPKTLIRYIVRHIAQSADRPGLREVLVDILDTPVSPELLPAKDGEIAQKTENIVGPYELHDFYLYYMMRWGFSPEKIFRLAQKAFSGAYSDREILQWLRTFYRRFFAQQFKRSCLPDGPKVGSVALSPRGDWRMPSDASAAAWLKEIDRLAEEEKMK